MTASACVLVTGGAGYIGSHAVLALRDARIPVVVLDNLSTGRRAAVPEDAIFIEADLAETDRVREVIGDYRVDAVMHFAGSIVVPESMEKPLAYYRNNTVNSHALIESCVALGVPRFIFSSTAAVYGQPERIPALEETPTRPINPYGASKLMTEWMLRDAAAAHAGFDYVALRYFNVAGADPAGRTGQSTAEATHLIKVGCQAALGQRDSLAVFGDDYDTADGTCVRDYIHVTDLADAHLRALEHLREAGASLVLNCGYGHGYSVREVIAAVERVVGHSFPVRQAPRRAGDPPSLVAGTKRIREILKWNPRHDDLDFIVSTALAWERTL
jgi:UDP-glucose 4-epimerase